MAATASQREQRGSTELCFLVTATEFEGMVWDCVWEGAGGVLEKSSSPERGWVGH